MRPFRMFFGLAIGIILFLFVARVVFFAFIIAALMSVVYAMFRRFKDFVTYDRYGRPYMPQYSRQTAIHEERNDGAEPLFYDRVLNHRQSDPNAHTINVS